MHTPFQIENFIVGRGNPTAYARLRQAEREIRKRRRAAEDLAFSVREIELDLADLRARWCLSRRARERRALQMERRFVALSEALLAIAENAEELAQFEALEKSAREDLGELSSEERLRLDAEMWCEKLRGMLAVDLLAQGRPSAGTVELLACFPEALRGPILADMRATVAANIRGQEGKLIEELFGG